MRWYWVPCLCASRLKNSTLYLESAIVILTPSSRKASASGGGRKSLTIFSRPSGSFVYLIRLLINTLTLAPKSSAKDADDAPAVGESHGQHAAADTAETVIALFHCAMGSILSDHTPGIRKGMLRFNKRHAMLGLVIEVLLRIPIESSLCHRLRPAWRGCDSHTKVWLREPRECWRYPDQAS
jgi:hypothetical protein